MTDTRDITGRLERIEYAIAQLAAALRQCSGWNPEKQGQTTLSQIVEDAQARQPKVVA